jgi:hypothetical protein
MALVFIIISKGMPKNNKPIFSDGPVAYSYVHKNIAKTFQRYIQKSIPPKKESGPEPRPLLQATILFHLRGLQI